MVKKEKKINFEPFEKNICKKLELSAGSKKVDLTLGKGVVFHKSFAKKIKSLSKNIVVITDSNVNKLYGKYFLEESGLNPLLIEIPSGEESKCRKTKEYIEDRMLKDNFKRDSIIIAVGGGMVSDIAAFVSSTYYRGVSLVIVPTTLLSMVDAAIGGKCGLNTAYGKNLIGSFYQPDLIFIDLTFLDTLPEKEWLNGFSEIIKYGIISDEKLFEELYNKKLLKLDELIYRCCRIKKEIVEKDEKDNGARILLNFGHSIGHSLEHLEEYRISHGEAISVGMIFAAYLSMKERYVTKEEFFKIFSIFKKYKYPLTFSEKVSWKKIMESLKYDKKTKEGHLGFVLLEKIGKARLEKGKYLHEIEEQKVKEALIWLHKRFISKREAAACRK